MIRIKVQYDEFTRTFKLIDDDFRTLLEGDALYDLNLPLMDEVSSENDLLVAPGTRIANA